MKGKGIIGLDPGLAAFGYGMVKSEAGELHLTDYGVIKTEAKISFPLRLKKIYNELKQIIKQCDLSIAVIEELFFAKNVKMALSVGQARGVAILACVDAGLDIVSYTPLEVKQAIVGYGRASKYQIQEMVKRLLNLEKIPPVDAADALALAICHIHCIGN